MTKQPPRILALLIGLVLAAIIVGRLALQEAETTVYVMKDNVAEGTELSPEMVQSRQLRTIDVAGDPVRDPAELKGRTAAGKLYIGSVLLRPALSEPSKVKTLPSGQAIAENEVVFPIILDVKHGINPILAKAGEKIDLLWLAGEPPTIKTVASSVRVGYSPNEDGSLIYLVIEREKETEFAYYVSVGQLFIVAVNAKAAPLDPLPVYAPTPVRPLATPVPTPRPAATPAPVVPAPTASPRSSP